MYVLALAEYFQNGSPLVLPTLHSLLDRLRTILAWFDLQRDYAFYSSSILFVYDATLPAKCDARMIDFTHVFDARAAPDENYRFGLANLVREFEALIARIEGEKATEMDGAAGGSE